jgi:hypothetical protein
MTILDSYKRRLEIRKIRREARYEKIINRQLKRSYKNMVKSNKPWPVAPMPLWVKEEKISIKQHTYPLKDFPDIGIVDLVNEAAVQKLFNENLAQLKSAGLSSDELKKAVQNIQPKGADNGWKSIYDNPHMDSAIRAMTNDKQNAQTLKEREEVLKQIEEMKKMEVEFAPKFQTMQTPDYRSPAMMVVHDPVKRTNIFVRVYRYIMEHCKSAPSSEWKLKIHKVVAINEQKSAIYPNIIVSKDDYNFIVLSRLYGWPWNQVEETREYFSKRTSLNGNDVYLAYQPWQNNQGTDVDSETAIKINSIMNEFLSTKVQKEKFDLFNKIKEKAHE